MSTLLGQGERIDDLQLESLKIIQSASAFCFSMDSVLLADFSTLRPRDKVVDIGTGNGILLFLLYGREKKAQFHGFEIQPAMADMASRSVAMNRLAESITIHSADLATAPAILGHGYADLVICNPPYSKDAGIMVNPSEKKRIARHEGETGITDFVRSASALLRTKGRFSVVFPAQRVLSILDEMRQVRIEPKRLRFVHAKVDRAPYIALIEGVKLGKPMLQVLPPLIVYDEEGNETEELKSIYHR